MDSSEQPDRQLDQRDVRPPVYGMCTFLSFCPRNLADRWLPDRIWPWLAVCWERS
jgi:hypothetical protein